MRQFGRRLLRIELAADHGRVFVGALSLVLPQHSLCPPELLGDLCEGAIERLVGVSMRVFGGIGFEGTRLDLHGAGERLALMPKVRGRTGQLAEVLATQFQNAGPAMFGEPVAELDIRTQHVNFLVNFRINHLDLRANGLTKRGSRARSSQCARNRAPNLLVERREPTCSRTNSFERLESS